MTIFLSIHLQKRRSDNLTVIPQEFIEEVLERTDIVEIIEPRVTLKNQAKTIQGFARFTMRKAPRFRSAKRSNSFIVLVVRRPGLRSSF